MRMVSAAVGFWRGAPRRWHAQAAALAVVGVLVMVLAVPAVVAAVAAGTWGVLAGWSVAAAVGGAFAVWLLGRLVTAVGAPAGAGSRALAGPPAVELVRGVLVWVAATLAVSLAAGLVSVGVWWVVAGRSGAAGSGAQVRAWVTPIVVLAAVAVVPAVFTVVVRLWAGAGSLAVAWAQARARYARVGSVVAVSAAAGAGAWWVAGLVPGAMVSRVVLAVVLVGIGQPTVLAAVRAAITAAPDRARPGGATLTDVSGFLRSDRRSAVVARLAAVAVVAGSLVAGVVVPAGSAQALQSAQAQAVAQARLASMPQALVPSTRLPGEVAPDPAPLRAPDEVSEPAQVPGEVVDAGDGWVTYQTGARSFETVLGGVQATFVDDDGEVALVDNTLVPVAETADAPAHFVNAANDFEVSIPAVVDADHGIEFAKDGYRVSLFPTAGDWSRPVAQGSAVLFNDVFDGIDVQYTLIGGVVKEDVIVNHFVDVPPMTTVVRVTGGLDLGMENGVLAARATTGRGSVESGDVVFSFSAPAMTDGAGALSDAVEMSVDGSGPSATLTVTADAGWIADPARVFPIRIDPTVDIAASAVTLVGVEQGSPDSRIGDNGFPYAGYDDGVRSGNLELFDTAHLMTRSYVGVSYDFQNIMREARIDSASFDLMHYTSWSGGATAFGLYTVDQPWDPGAITWNSQLSSSHTYVGQTSAVGTPGGGYLSWDIRSQVNDWVQGIAPQNGFVVKAIDERNMQAEVFRNKASAAPPRLVVNWSIPDPVDPNRPLNDVSVSVRPVTEKSMAGKQIVDGVFADGLARPDSWVSYVLDPTGAGDRVQASRSYKYPNSSAWEADLPNGTKYSDKLSNWQTGLYGQLAFDSTYQYAATATDGVSTSARALSDKFLIYQVKATDTLPFIAKYYGVALDTLMADNKVQDTLALSQNTLFIRNPNTTVPYNAGSHLTDAQKRQIDSNLMGRGLHCEYGFEPINLNTGNFWLAASDVSIPGATGGFGLTRSYNSVGDLSRSVFGFGWSFDYSEYLVRDGDGALVYFTADGKQLRFTANGDGTYTGPDGFGLTITEVAFTRGEDTLVRFDMTSTTGAKRAFDAWGLLTSITARDGSVTTLGYDGNLNLTSVTSAAGGRLGFGYDQHGRVVSVTRPDGVVLGYGYDEAGDLVSFTDGNGNQTTYAYDSAHRMTSWTDQNGVRVVANTYDELGRVTAQADAEGGVARMDYQAGRTTAVDAAGNQTVYELDAQHRTTAITYPDGQQVTRTYSAGNTLASDENGRYTYDAAGNRTSATNVAGNTTMWEYDQFGQVTNATDADGRTTTYTYDGAGNLTAKVGPGGGTDTYTWEQTPGGAWRLTGHTDARGITETYGYDGAGDLPQARTDGAGNTTGFAYNPMGQVTSTTDPAGAVTRITYDKAGVQTAVQAPDGGVTTYTLDKVGNPVAVTDPSGHTTTFTLDGMRRITKVVDPAGATTTNTYDKVGNLVSETNALGEKTKHTYDSRGRLVASKDAAGGKWEFAFDEDGNVTEVTDAAGARTTYAYDPATGARTGQVDALGGRATFEYTATGLMAASTAPDGARTSFEYDPAGRMAQMTEPSGLVTTLTYDDAGNVTGLDVGGRTYGYVYDDAGNMVSSTDAEGRQATYEYDATGRVAKIVDESGRATTMTYDAVGRTTSITDGEGGTTRYEYDLAGNQTSHTDPNGNVTTYAYDALNHLVGVQEPTGAVTTYAYDAAERMVTSSDPFGADTTYEYDPVGHLTQVTDPAGNTVKYTVNAVGQVVGETDQAGNTTSRELDALGQLITLTTPDERETTFTYDPAGRLTGTATSDERTESFTYDQAGRLTGAVDAQGRTAAWEYNPFGEVTAETGFDQVTTAYEYDNEGQVTKATTGADGAGAGTVTFERDPVGNITKLTQVDGAAWEYGYDAAGRTTTQTDPTGAVTGFTYDQGGNLTAVTDALQGVTTYGYDAGNRPVSVTDAAGNTTGYEFDALNRLTKVTRPQGDQTVYAYDTVGNLAAMTDAAGGVTGYTYDPRGLLTEQTDQNGAVSTLAWDRMGRLSSESDPLGRTVGYEYTSAGQLARLTDPAGGVYTYAYDKIDRLTAVTDPAGYTRTLDYDQGGNVAAEKDSLGRTASYVWDALHHLTSATDAAGQTTSYAYDDAGRVTTQTDPTGGTWTYAYDLLGRVTEQGDPNGDVSTAGYDVLGRATTTTHTDGQTTGYTYDPVGNLTAVTDPNGHAASYTYDANNRLTSATDKAGQTTTMAWDGMDRLTAVTDPAGAVTSMGYDGVGNLTSRTDARGAATQFTYDQASQLTEVLDPLGGVTTMSYDVLGNVSSVSDPRGNTTSYTYDAMSNLTSVTSPEGAVEQWLYDPASRLVEQIRPGGATTVYDYDEVNRLVTASHPKTEMSETSWAYDGNGARVSMADATGESTYTRDPAGRLTSVTDGQGRTIGYAYDPNGQISELTYPDGTTVTYGYDEDGNLVTVTDQSGTSTYTYDDADQVVSLTRPDGTVTAYTYDVRGQVETVETTDGDGTLISRYGYAYDEAGSATGETATTPDADGTLQLVERAYTYDAAGRLSGYTQTAPVPVIQDGTPLSVPIAGGAGKSAPTPATPSGEAGAVEVAYTYDEAGNRTAATRTENGTVTEQVEYAYDGDNKLTTAVSSLSGTTTYTYGPAGELAGTATSGADASTADLAFEYDADLRLNAIRDGGRLLMAATYDGDGNRVFQVTRRPVTGEQTTQFPVTLKAETGGEGTAEAVFTWRDDQMLASAAGAFWYGFASQVAAMAAGVNTSASVAGVDQVREGWSVIDVRLPRESGLDQDDADSLAQAGLTPEDVDDVLAGMGVTSGGSTLIPDKTVALDGFAYDLVHYVNDVNTASATGQTGNVQALATYGPGGSQIASYTYGGGQRLTMTATPGPTTDWLTGNTTGNTSTGENAGGVTGWFVPDGRGSVGQVTTSGGIAYAGSYDPWGAPDIAVGGSAAPRFGFSGEEYNPVTGLQYLRARYYQPTDARFTQADTMLGDPSNPVSLNRYAYGWDDPVGMVDPSGMWPSFLDKAIRKVASAAWSVVKRVAGTPAVKAAASWVNKNVIQPAATALKAASWVNTVVTRPASVPNAVTAVIRTGRTVAAATAVAARQAQERAVRAYRSTTAYAAQRTAQIKAKLVEFACSGQSPRVSSLIDALYNRAHNATVPLKSDPSKGWLAQVTDFQIGSNAGALTVLTDLAQDALVSRIPGGVFLQSYEQTRQLQEQLDYYLNGHGTLGDKLQKTAAGVWDQVSTPWKEGNAGGIGQQVGAVSANVAIVIGTAGAGGASGSMRAGANALKSTLRNTPRTTARVDDLAATAGALSDDIAATFVGGRYTASVLKEDTVFYRAGTAGKPFGQYFSTEKPAGVLQTRIDKAIPPRWPDGSPAPLDTGYAIRIPAGTTIYSGEVANQGGIYMGGTGQTFVPKPWDIPGAEIVGSWGLK